MMRVTQNSTFDTMRDSMNVSKGRMEKLQTEASTLKKLNTPSDDPIGSSKVLEVRTDKVNNEQFLMNAKLAEAFLNNSDHALEELGDIVVRAKEIAIGQSSGASSNEETRLGVAEEVTQLYEQAISAANRRIGDRYIFGGYKTDRPPVDPDGRYHGDDGQMMAEISRDVYLSMNVPGMEAFNTNPKSSADAHSIEFQKAQRAPSSKSAAEEGPENQNINLFNELQSLRIGLLTGDLDGIRNTLERFDQLHGSITATRAKIGSRIRGLASTQTSLERHTITNAQLSSQIEDADMAQVMNDLAKEETVFRTVLQSGQRLIQPTLMSFLK
jgi:flagellar hook-associated protein 3 FlgL